MQLSAGRPTGRATGTEGGAGPVPHLAPSQVTATSRKPDRRPKISECMGHHIVSHFPSISLSFLSLSLLELINSVQQLRSPAMRSPRDRAATCPAPGLGSLVVSDYDLVYNAPRPAASACLCGGHRLVAVLTYLDGQLVYAAFCW